MMDYVCCCPNCGTLYDNHKSGQVCDRLVIDGDSVKKCDGYLTTEDLQDDRLQLLTKDDITQMQEDITMLKEKMKENEEFREEYIGFLQKIVKNLSDRVFKTEEEKKIYKNAMRSCAKHSKVTNASK